MTKKSVILVFSMLLISSFFFASGSFAEPKASHPSNIVVENWKYCVAGLFCSTPAGQVTWVANNAGTIYDSKERGRNNFHNYASRLQGIFARSQIQKTLK